MSYIQLEYKRDNFEYLVGILFDTNFVLGKDTKDSKGNFPEGNVSKNSLNCGCSLMAI